MAMLSHEKRAQAELLRKRDREMIPRTLLRAMLALVLVVLGIVTWARLTDRPLTALPPADVPVAAERPIILEGSMSGAARVFDLNGVLIADLDETKGGFVAGIWRVLVRERAKHGLPAALPVRLVLFADGRLGLRDDFTGWRAELVGFGQDNYAAFRRLLD